MRTAGGRGGLSTVCGAQVRVLGFYSLRALEVFNQRISVNELENLSGCCEESRWMGRKGRQWLGSGFRLISQAKKVSFHGVEAIALTVLPTEGSCFGQNKAIKRKKVLGGFWVLLCGWLVWIYFLQRWLELGGAWEGSHLNACLQGGGPA